MIVLIVGALALLLFVSPAQGSALPPRPVLIVVAGLSVLLAIRAVKR